MSTVVEQRRPLDYSVLADAPLTWTLAVAAVIATLAPGMSTLLEYDSAAIAGRQCWRIVTGHFTHWSFDHLLWDWSVFVGLGVLCERRSRWALVACVLGTALATSLLMLATMPEVPTYRGLSGIDTALFTLLANGMYADARRSHDRAVQWMIVVAAAALLAKLVYELAFGATIFVDHQDAFIPIVAAHIVGALVGILTGVIELRSSALPLCRAIHQTVLATARTQSDLSNDESVEQ